MKGLMMAELGAGGAKGLASAQQYERERPIRDLRLQEAKMQQEKAQLEFGEWKENKGNRDARIEADTAQAKQLAYTASSQLLREQTYNSFKQYDADGDPRHLNNFLKAAKSNPVGQDVYSNILRVDSLNNANRWEVEKIMRQAGYEDPAEILDSPDLAKDFVTFIDAQGNLGVASMTQLKAATGYTQHLSQQELAELEMRAKIENLLTGPKSAETSIIRDLAKAYKADNPGASDYEAFTQAFKIAKASRAPSSALERLAETIKANNPGISDEEAARRAKQLMSTGTEAEREARMLYENGTYGSYAEAFEAVTSRREQTSTMKNAGAARELRSTIDEIAGGDLFKLDMSDTNNRRKVQPYIAELEQISGREMSTEDKRVARDLRNLHALGATAGSELSEQETGLIDRFLGGIKKYTSDLGGKKGVAAYETFRNIFRNSLYGASLTNAEISNFDNAAGTLGQQLGPVLQQMQVQMESVRNQMQAIYDMNDEYVAYYYLGADLDTLDATIAAMDERIALVRERAGGNLANMTPAQIREQQLGGALPLPPAASTRSSEENLEIMRQARGTGQ